MDGHVSKNNPSFMPARVHELRTQVPDAVYVLFEFYFTQRKAY